jgi:hypothetical protein
MFSSRSSVLGKKLDVQWTGICSSYRFCFFLTCPSRKCI